MKNYYFLLCAFIVSLAVNSQDSSNCEDANYYLTSAYSHVKSSYDSNNVSHLKYYANRSLESYKLANDLLPSCDCKEAEKIKQKATEALAKVELAETFEDGRFFVKRAREAAQQIITALDQCADGTYVAPEEDLVASNTETTAVKIVSTNESSSLSDLERRQKELLRQQEELKRKTEALKAKMANEQQMQLKKQKETLATSYRKTVDETIKNYNLTLDKCECDAQKIMHKSNYLNTTDKSINEIKSYYITIIEELTSDYLNQLNSCKS